MQIRSTEIRKCEYPESEAMFAEWQQTILDSNPGSLVVKLAFENLAFGDANSVQRAAQEDDFTTAQRLFLEQEAPGNTYAPQIRPYTDAGHRFFRFHAVQLGELGQGHSPSVYSGYWRRLSLYFAYLNGPLGGETTYVVPQDIALQSGLGHLPYEAHAIFGADNRVKGAATVEYNSERTAIIGRSFFGQNRLVSAEAGFIREKLLATAVTARYRVPQFEPPQAVQEKLGLAPVATADFAPAPQSFDDLLPPAFRW